MFVDSLATPLAELAQNVFTACRIFHDRYGGNVIIVCGGARDERPSPYDVFLGAEHVSVVVDAARELFGKCGIRHTPSAVIFDSAGQRTKSGRMVWDFGTPLPEMVSGEKHA